VEAASQLILVSDLQEPLDRDPELTAGFRTLRRVAWAGWHGQGFKDSIP
jgi:hypothetical protein